MRKRPRLARYLLKKIRGRLRLNSTSTGHNAQARASAIQFILLSFQQNITWRWSMLRIPHYTKLSGLVWSIPFELSCHLTSVSLVIIISVLSFNPPSFEILAPKLPPLALTCVMVWVPFHVLLWQSSYTGRVAPLVVFPNRVLPKSVGAILRTRGFI